jgi:hypothetical protein
MLSFSFNTKINFPFLSLLLWRFHKMIGFITSVGIVRKDLYCWAMLGWVQDFALIIKNLPQMIKVAPCCGMETVAWGMSLC